MNNPFKRDPKTARLGHEIYPFKMGYLPDFFQRKSEVELKDTPENRKRGLTALREMIAKDKHLHCMNLDEDFLLQYLRCRKMDAARAFTKLKSFAHLRKRHIGAFTQFSFERCVVSMKSKSISILPHRCQDGCVVILIELDNWIPDDFPPEEVKRFVVIMLMQSLRDPMTQVNGFKVIFDVKSNPVKHIRYATPNNIHLIYYGPWECSSGRFKEVHIVNNSLTFKTAWFIVKQFLTPKLKSRIYFHSDEKELLDFFPAACLPVQYGGELNNYDMSDWLYEVMTPEAIKTLAGS